MRRTGTARVAQIDAAGRPDEEIVLPVGARFHVGAEGRASRVHKLIRGALGGRDLARQPNHCDRHVLAFFLVESERLGSARQRAQAVDALDDPADDGDVAVEVARGVADHRIELAARARVGRQVAANADIAVAMGEVRRAGLGVVSDRPASGEAGARRIVVGVAEWPDRKALQRAMIFGGRLGDDAGRKRLGALVIAPLDDVIVLDAVDCRAAPPAAFGQRADVGDMDRREFGRELDHDPRAIAKIHDQQVVGRMSRHADAGASATISEGVLGFAGGAAATRKSGGNQKQCAHRIPPSKRTAWSSRRLRAPLSRRPMHIATLMLLGSGELGREFAIAAKRLGCRVIACDRYENAPAMQVADAFEVFPMLDGKALRAAVEKHKPDVIIPEIEAIDTETLGRAGRAKAGASLPRPKRCS